MKEKESNVLVELNNVSKIFKKGAWALKKVNLKIHRNEIVTFLGANGSGKSVLASIIANNLAQTAGFIDYYFTQDSVFNSVGIQFRDQSWPSGFITKDIIELYKNIFLMEDEVWIQTLIEVFEINAFINKPLSKLSVVNLQMFSLFLAFFHKPELVVVDEISSSIGYNFRTRIFEFFESFVKNYNGTLIIVSPDHDFIDQYASRVIFLNDGHIIDDRSIFELEQKYLSAANYIKKISNEITSKIIKPKPDPFFKPILRDYNLQLTGLKKQIEKAFEKYTFVKESSFEIFVENILFYFDEIANEITELSNQSLEKENVINLRRLIKSNTKRSKVELQKIKRFIKQNSNFLKLKKIEKLIKDFIDYLNIKVKPIFRSNEIIFGGKKKKLLNINSDQTELEKMKQKYIRKELKIIKMERKNYKKFKRSLK
ncbi:ATP-binding cassette domain-containing protein [Spiroplasma alleghenense]|uniref:ABC transporter ATP-binding protein n=1 Tax=Spiroplasma alleghenense TaxID=216931 RepID=A0A345Z3W2_9MOLU|nr:ATP-binding cassette domain-containing protein [Spiroplasma alleghenense]AXK51291.1 ABC transporter ATP-binding protein [Spiroplasma alleghenense]